MIIRKPVVSGLFYDNDSKNLEKSIEDCFLHELGPGKIPKFNDNNHDSIYGAIIPHAGYYYSGPVSANAYFQLVENGFPDTFIIICPNHTGIYSSPISIFNEGLWETPLGNVEIDSDFANELISNCDIIDNNVSPHLNEHSCEVHLPFLQYFSKDFKIVPIVMSSQNIDSAEKLANIIIKTSKKLKTSIVTIASTDFTHYKSKNIATKQDRLVLDAIAELDEYEMMNIVNNFNISMCGHGPTFTTIRVSRDFGAKSFSLLKYASSGDISGDLDSVVGYAAGIFK
jgi:AmmeMemoRadiSam system protein B